ncbi:MAG: pyrroloquinoline quinone biosynthesis protein PqqE [Gemmatimonadales bacterium]|nr:pyrroloquinoline quinone biosynthesis protein PqqE [Gemmatimonadales bacterium]
MSPDLPTTLLAELTHRCPLRCPYCSNPLDLARADVELSTVEWQRVLSEARALGVLQVGLSGGEPLVRRDLETITAHAHQLGFYTTLVTSALGLTPARAEALRTAGLDHVQISFQDADDDDAARIAGGMPGAGRQKRAAAALVCDLGFAFSINVVLHRANIEHVAGLIALAEELGADRLELANTQYYGWALLNRDALMPTREQVAAAESIVREAMPRLRGRLRVLYVLPDYHGQYPKPCYGGWGRSYMVITPGGHALPCHGATSIDSLAFPSVREHSLDAIWHTSSAFEAFRGEEWMRDPCRSCARRSIDFGGCRCQAFALTGEAERTDPVCILSPDRGLIDHAVAPVATPEGYAYREFRQASGTSGSRTTTTR